MSSNDAAPQSSTPMTPQFAQEATPAVNHPLSEPVMGSKPRLIPKELNGLHIDRFEQWFQDEPADLEWARPHESELYSLFGSSELTFASLEIECRATICRVQAVLAPSLIQSRTPPIGDLLLPFLQRSKLNGLDGRADSENGLALFYLHTDGLARVLREMPESVDPRGRGQVEWRYDCDELEESVSLNRAECLANTTIDSE
jgi:hypothetical protein